MRGVISWAGKRSDQFGITVEKYPGYTKPERKVDRYNVPGRNGDIVLMQDAWENVEQSYQIVAGDGEMHSVPGSFGMVADWLCSPKGYCELWDEFDPTHFRLACFIGSFDVDSLSVGRVGRTTIRFDCKPQRFLMSGKAEIVISSSPAVVSNPTAYNARPLLFVQRSGSGSGTVTVNGTVFTISDIPTAGLYIDCEEMNCYDSNYNNMNNVVSSSTSEFAILSPGQNSIGFTGRVQRVTITPRWFEI